MNKCIWDADYNLDLGILTYKCRICDKRVDKKILTAECGMKTVMFSVGTSVNKRKGYKFPGEVRAVFTNSNGEIRYVVELRNFGLLHIFNEDQLMEQD